MTGSKKYTVGYVAPEPELVPAYVVAVKSLHPRFNEDRILEMYCDPGKAYDLGCSITTTVDDPLTPNPITPSPESRGTVHSITRFTVCDLVHGCNTEIGWVVSNPNPHEQYLSDRCEKIWIDTSGEARYWRDEIKRLTALDRF